jgi:hypothetical protein
MLVLFALWQFRFSRRVPLSHWAAFFVAFLLIAGPMIQYILGNWAEYSKRAQQVSIMNDVRAKGWNELYISFIKHLQCFNFRGDFNARQNIHFWPQLDFVTGALFFPALIWSHLRAFKDPRASLFVLWFWIMMSAGIFSMTVEAPQGHRTILVTPALALMTAWFLSELWAGLGPLWEGGWPRSLQIGLWIVLAAVPLANAIELYNYWPDDAATWRSFSPESSLAARRAAQSPGNWLVYSSSLDKEYQFHGFERNTFIRFLLKQQGRYLETLQPANLLHPGDEHLAGILAIWNESDDGISAAAKAEFPDIKIEEAKDPYEARSDYLAMEIPMEKVPKAKAGQKKLFFAK